MNTQTAKSRPPARGWILGVAALALLTPPGGAGASTLIFGGGMAQDCSEAVVRGRSDDTTMRLCTSALEVEALKSGDRARTLVNRGVIQLRRKAYVEARDDFDAAGRIDPKLGEAYVNRGAAFVAEERFVEGLAEIDRGLALGVVSPERAFYNRGLAHENLGDLPAAYRDYRRASELDPDWAAPKEELARFSIESP
ncbi:tetratricopeptide repeat protein [Caulobacter hibisci]|uniref:Tetratricopeptide repeat protein n=1 Tax=Caulobacter hibisci TaxID=2035993 RepID=A0ABS0SS76_9CAUL|nr:tetratricopeptide repeat protein [Caulobacter hibisci]MBI1682428.1 tetratricopeptide repeat protein [Caulobacter hibisci]